MPTTWALAFVVLVLQALCSKSTPDHELPPGEDHWATKGFVDDGSSGLPPHTLKPLPIGTRFGPFADHLIGKTHELPRGDMDKVIKNEEDMHAKLKKKWELKSAEFRRKVSSLFLSLCGMCLQT